MTYLEPFVGQVERGGRVDTVISGDIATLVDQLVGDKLVSVTDFADSSSR